MDWLSDYTLRNAVLGATLLGLTSGLLSPFAVLRRQSLLGDALAHAALPGICLGFMLAGSRALLPLLAGALAAGVVAVLTIALLTGLSRLKEDAALGIVLSVFFAIGTVLLTFIQGNYGAAGAGLETFLLGQAAAILPRDLVVLAGGSAIALGAVGLLFKEAKLVSFDPGFARAIGLHVTALQTILTLLIAVAVVVGIQLVGVVLMSAMLVAPAAAARQWSRSLETMVALSVAFAVTSGVAGAILSAGARGLATGPVIVLVASGIALASLFFAPRRGVIWRLVTERRGRDALPAMTVLRDLRSLADTHDDPHYAGEEGMIDALYGARAAPALERLERMGLVERTQHMEGEGRHWRLTKGGLERSDGMPGTARLGERREES